MTPLRIAIVNWTARVAGGIETYLRDLLPALAGRGHAVGLFAERDVPAGRPPIGGETRLLGSPGDARQLLGSWRPDVVYLHGLDDPLVEAAVFDAGPVAYFAHYYRGTCVSGEKSHKVPRPVPCARIFGPPCLVLFYPRRCGGLNPVTMVRDYARQQARLERLRRADRIVTASAHMRSEYLRHGIEPARLVHLALPVPAPPAPGPGGEGLPSRLLWAGRMERPKGGALFLDAASEAQALLGRTLSLTLAGDGRDHAAWERRARALKLVAEFPGWVESAGMDRLFAAADLLVMSSVWPEPYGRVGLEAGRHGVPVAAFALGGIPEWLRDGVNGRLAPGDPPRATGLARAIAKALRDPADYARLRAGARAAAERHTFADHVVALEQVFRAMRRG